MWHLLMTAAQRLLLTLHLSLNVCAAPCRPIATVYVDDTVRGEVCLTWQSDDEAGLTCWPTEQYGHVVVKSLLLHNAGSYQIRVAAGNVVSNVATVEVR